MRCERLRLVTYLFSINFWSKSNDISPTELASAGFFYFGNNKVICAFCRVVIGDNAMEKHKQLNPSCHFVNGNEWSNKSFEHDSELTYDYNTSKHPAHQQYINTFARTQTFSLSNWKSTAVHSTELVNAGFFYTNFAECVKCFHCGGVLQNFLTGDDPVEMHAKLYPECHFMINTYGAMYIEFALFKNYVIALREQLTIPLEFTRADITNMKMFQYENFLNLKKSVNRLVIGFNKITDLDKRFFVQQYLRNFLFLTDCQELFQCMICIGLLPKADTTTTIEATETIEISSPLSFFENWQKSELGFSSNNANFRLPILKRVPNAIGIFSLKDNLFESESNVVNFFNCALCCDNKIELAFVPCGHLFSCRKCFKRLKNCPVCRCSIANKMRVYFPN
ncbi:inhibition of apoptosis protein repeat, partial [Tyrophagus putrescentiae]